MNVCLVRHPKPAVAEGICYGWTDISLPDNFERDCRLLLTRLAGWRGKPVYSSPLIRCQEFARLLGPAHCDDRLKEINFGDWEMRRWDDIDRGKLDEWCENFVEVAPPGGESFHALQRRAVSFLEDMQANGANAAIVVTHAGVIRALISYVRGLSLRESFNIDIPFGSVTQLKLDQVRGPSLQSVPA